MFLLLVFPGDGPVYCCSWTVGVGRKCCQHLCSPVKRDEELLQQSSDSSQCVGQVGIIMIWFRNILHVILLYSFHILFAILEVIRNDFPVIYNKILPHQDLFPLFHYPVYRWPFLWLTVTVSTRFETAYQLLYKSWAVCNKTCEWIYLSKLS